MVCLRRAVSLKKPRQHCLACIPGGPPVRRESSRSSEQVLYVTKGAKATWQNTGRASGTRSPYKKRSQGYPDEDPDSNSVPLETTARGELVTEAEAETKPKRGRGRGRGRAKNVAVAPPLVAETAKVRCPHGCGRPPNKPKFNTCCSFCPQSHSNACTHRFNVQELPLQDLAVEEDLLSMSDGAVGEDEGHDTAV